MKLIKNLFLALITVFLVSCGGGGGSSSGEPVSSENTEIQLIATPSMNISTNTSPDAITYISERSIPISFEFAGDTQATYGWEIVNKQVRSRVAGEVLASGVSAPGKVEYSLNDLPDGYYDLSVNIYNSAGSLLSEIDMDDLYIETDAPAVEVTTQFESLIIDSANTCSFTISPPTSADDLIVWQIKENGVVLANGTITYTDSGIIDSLEISSLANGVHALRLTAYNKSGMSSEVAFNSFTVDTEAPEASVVTEPSGVTSDNTLSYSFTIDSTAAGWQIKNGTTVLASGTSTGNISVNLEVLADNIYNSLYLYVWDTNGNTGQLDLANVTIDTNAPSAVIISESSGVTNDNTPTYTFVIDTDATGWQVRNGTTVLKSGTTTGNIDVTLDTLPDGTYTNLNVRVWDAGNNESQTDLPSVTIDTNAPLVIVNSQTSGVTNNNLLSYNLDIASDATGWQIRNGTTVLKSGIVTGSSVTVTLDILADGTYTNLNVYIWDNANNRRQIDLAAVTIDTGAPSIVINTDFPSSTSDTTPAFNVTVESGASFILEDRDNANTVLYSGTGTGVQQSLSLTTALAEGTYGNIYLVAEDGAHNPHEIQMGNVDIDTTVEGILSQDLPIYYNPANNGTIPPSFKISGLSDKVFNLAFIRVYDTANDVEITLGFLGGILGGEVTVYAQLAQSYPSGQVVARVVETNSDGTTVVRDFPLGVYNLDQNGPSVADTNPESEVLYTTDADQILKSQLYIDTGNSTIDESYIVPENFEILLDDGFGGTTIIDSSSFTITYDSTTGVITFHTIGQLFNGCDGGAAYFRNIVVLKDEAGNELATGTIFTDYNIINH